MRTDSLLAHYPVRIREVTIGVILFLTFTFYFFPRFLGEGERTNFTFIEEIETFDIPQTEQMKIPEPPPRPSVPIASEDEFFDEDITIEDTDFDDFEDWDTPPPPPSEGPNVKVRRSANLSGFGQECARRSLNFYPLLMFLGLNESRDIRAINKKN